jgi:hypothetical protein
MECRLERGKEVTRSGFFKVNTITDSREGDINGI